MQKEHSDIVIYESESGRPEVEVRLFQNDIWVTQKHMADLFGVNRPAITKHLKNIFLSNELQEVAVCSIMEHTATDGKKY